ncbi:hypothetical protein GCM10023185_42780 [Hymenobacter saemangeumensis]|uniref:Carboxypeptidase-like regulatory domain-containing protein n=2 Tax=Hymenobacter saemangeumensis TaxID=1084522 RepID=A0ABP8IRV0_9BACT
MVVIKGIVRRQNGKVLPGASVFPASEPDLAVVTDQNGAFELTVPASQLPAGVLTIAYAGLADYQVAMEKAQQQPLLVTLPPKTK